MGCRGPWYPPRQSYEGALRASSGFLISLKHQPFLAKPFLSGVQRKIATVCFHFPPACTKTPYVYHKHRNSAGLKTERPGNGLYRKETLPTQAWGSEGHRLHRERHIFCFISWCFCARELCTSGLRFWNVSVVHYLSTRLLISFGCTLIDEISSAIKYCSLGWTRQWKAPKTSVFVCILFILIYVRDSPRLSLSSDRLWLPIWISYTSQRSVLFFLGSFNQFVCLIVRPQSCQC